MSARDDTAYPEGEEREGMVMLGGKWVCDGCGRDPCRCHWDDARYDSPDEDIDIDVCQNCAGYFAWTPELREAWREHWLSGREPTDLDRQPQRCRRCIVDECWVEDRDA